MFRARARDGLNRSGSAAIPRMAGNGKTFPFRKAPTRSSAQYRANVVASLPIARFAVRRPVVDN